MPSYKAPIDTFVSPGSRDKLRTQDVDSLYQDPLRAVKESYRASFFESENIQEGERLAEVLAVDMDVKLPSDLNYFGEAAVANQYGTRSWVSVICRIIDQHGTTPDPEQTYESPDGTAISIPFKETTRLRSNVGKFYAPLDDIQGKGALNIQVGDWLIVEFQDKLLRNNGVIKDIYLKKDLSTWKQVGTSTMAGGEDMGGGGITVTGQPFVGCGPNGPSIDGVDLAQVVGSKNAAAIFGLDPYCYTNNISASMCKFKPPCANASGHLEYWRNEQVKTWLKEVINLRPEVPPAVLAAIAVHEGGASFVFKNGNTGSHLGPNSGMVVTHKPRSSTGFGKIRPKTKQNWEQIPAWGWSAQCAPNYCNFGFGPMQMDASAHDLWAYYEEIGDWNPLNPKWASKSIEKAWLPAYQRAKSSGLPEQVAVAIAFASYNGGKGGKQDRYKRFAASGDMASAWAAVDTGTCGGSYGTGAFVIARLIACAIVNDPITYGWLKG